MNREIKFRAWNPFDQKMYYPTGDESALSPVSYDLGMWLGGWEVYEITAQHGKRIVVASQTRQGHKGGDLMQYTGLRDKNGAEIYEGDVLQETYMNVAFNKLPKEVRWHEHFAEYVFVDSSGKHEIVQSRAHTDIENSEIIGNIYENPELMKPKEGK